MTEQQQYPTPLQIAKALWQLDMDLPWTPNPQWQAQYLERADAVLALFPQPTPSGEPERIHTAADVQEAFERGCVRGEQDANERNWSRRQYEKMQASLPPAAPVSIADMAPGTTFEYGERWTVAHNLPDQPPHAHRNGLKARYLTEFDPSTIRNVTPPEDAA